MTTPSIYASFSEKKPDPLCSDYAFPKKGFSFIHAPNSNRTFKESFLFFGVYSDDVETIRVVLNSPELRPPSNKDSIGKPVKRNSSFDLVFQKYKSEAYSLLQNPETMTPLDRPVLNLGKQKGLISNLNTLYWEVDLVKERQKIKKKLLFENASFLKKNQSDLYCKRKVNLEEKFSRINKETEYRRELALTTRNKMRYEWRDLVKYSLEKSDVVKGLRKHWIQTERDVFWEREILRKWCTFLVVMRSLFFSKRIFDVALEEYKKHRDLIYFMQIFIVKFQRHMKIYKGPKYGQRLMLDTKMACLYSLSALKDEYETKAHRIFLKTMVHYQMLSSKLSKILLTSKRAKRVGLKWKNFIKNMKDYTETLKVIWNESVNLFFLQMKKGDLEKIKGTFTSVKLQFAQEYMYGPIRDKAIEEYKTRRVYDHMVKFKIFREKMEENRKRVMAIEAIDAILRQEEEAKKALESQKQVSEVSDESEEDSSGSDYEEAALGKDFKFRRRITEKTERIRKVGQDPPKLFVAPDHSEMVNLMKQSVQIEMAAISSSI